MTTKDQNEEKVMKAKSMADRARYKRQITLALAKLKKAGTSNMAIGKPAGIDADTVARYITGEREPSYSVGRIILDQAATL